MSAPSSPPSSSVSSIAPGSKTPRPNAIVFLLLLVVGTVPAGIGVSLAREQRQILTHSFPVPATVVGLGVEEYSRNGHSGTTYRPVVRFEYVIDGSTLLGDQTDVLRESRSGHWAWRVLDRYEVGQHVTAWVRSDVPGVAYLDRTPSRRPYIMLGSGGLFDLFIAFLWWRTRRRGTHEQTVD